MVRAQRQRGVQEPVGAVLARPAPFYARPERKPARPRQDPAAPHARLRPILRKILRVQRRPDSTQHFAPSCPVFFRDCVAGGAEASLFTVWSLQVPFRPGFRAVRGERVPAVFAVVGPTALAHQGQADRTGNREAQF